MLVSAIDAEYSGNISAEYTAISPNDKTILFDKTVGKDKSQKLDIILLDKMYILYSFSATSDTGKLKFELFENGKLAYSKTTSKQYVNHEIFFSTVKYETDIEPTILSLKL